jgi:hypothetical protein
MILIARGDGNQTKLLEHATQGMSNFMVHKYVTFILSHNIRAGRMGMDVE